MHRLDEEWPARCRASEDAWVMQGFRECRSWLTLLTAKAWPYELEGLLVTGLWRVLLVTGLCMSSMELEVYRLEWGMACSSQGFAGLYALYAELPMVCLFLPHRNVVAPSIFPVSDRCSPLWFPGLRQPCNDIVQKSSFEEEDTSPVMHSQSIEKEEILIDQKAQRSFTTRLRDTGKHTFSTEPVEQRTDRTCRDHIHIHLDQLFFLNVALFDHAPFLSAWAANVPAPERLSIGETIAIGKVTKGKKLKTWKSIGLKAQPAKASSSFFSSSRQFSSWICSHLLRKSASLEPCECRDRVLPFHSP